MKGERLHIAIAHLSNDKVLKPILAAIRLPERQYEDDLYLGLVKSIISQQLSVKAADTIIKRFLDLFEDHYPNPYLLLEMENTALRSVGLSGQKTNYVKNVAAYFIDNALFTYEWHNDSNEEIISKLTEIKGVGRWTVQMILMFVLQREDVFPVLDLGIQNGMKQLYSIDLEKKELIQKMESIANSWRPFRSVACFFLWALKDMPE